MGLCPRTLNRTRLGQHRLTINEDVLQFLLNEVFRKCGKATLQKTSVVPNAYNWSLKFVQGFFYKIAFTMFEGTRGVIRKSPKYLDISFIDMLPKTFSVASFNDANHSIINGRNERNIYSQPVILSRVLDKRQTDTLVFWQGNFDLTRTDNIRNNALKRQVRHLL